MNYRCLTEAELTPLREEFIQYLAANGIAGDDWQQMQKSDEGRAWVEGFSQVVWEKALPKIKTLELRSKNNWTCISVRKEEMKLLRMASVEEGMLYFDADNLFELLEAKASTLIAEGKLELVTGRKPLKNGHEAEVYALIEQGFKPCSNAIFAGLEKWVG